jgi:hypothetical protein
MTRGFPVGGWCPRGRLAEDGIIDSRYPLTETPLDTSAQRTAWNVRDSDGTLVLHFGEHSPGTGLTREEAQTRRKPLIRVDLRDNPVTNDVVAWVEKNAVHVLNVAGPRESEGPGVYVVARVFLDNVFRAFHASGDCNCDT